MSGVARPSRVVLTSETHPKSVGVCPRRLQPNVLGEKRGGALRCGAGQSVDLWRAFESSRATAPVLPTSEWVAAI